jgi:hypothetical protein
MELEVISYNNSKNHPTPVYTYIYIYIYACAWYQQFFTEQLWTRGSAYLLMMTLEDEPVPTLIS